MAKLYFNPVAITTFQRLFGVSSFVEFVNAGIPTIEAAEQDYLDHTAVAEGWEPGDYFAEKQELSVKFREWVPTYAAYSVLILLHGIVETQLFALADHIRKNRGLSLSVTDLAGRGLEQSALYLDRVLSVPVKSDPAWGDVLYLQRLRNLLAHSGGRVSATGKAREVANALVAAYPQKLRIEKDVIGERLWVSMNLCRHFNDVIEQFFERMFKITGLPNRHMQMDA